MLSEMKERGFVFKNTVHQSMEEAEYCTTVQPVLAIYSLILKLFMTILIPATSWLGLKYFQNLYLD